MRSMTDARFSSTVVHNLQVYSKTDRGLSAGYLTDRVKDIAVHLRTVRSGE